MNEVTRPGGVTIPFTVDGDGDGTGPHLLFAHGLIGRAALDRIALAPLVEAGWTVVTFSQRGHADASPVNDAALYDPDAMGADLWAVADAVGLERCWIGGGSMGAATSFRAARADPRRLEGLIQVGPAIRDTPHPLAPVFDGFANTLRDGGMDGFVATMRELLESMGRGPEAPEFAEGLRAHDPASLECAFRTVLRWTMADVPSGFAELPCPVVVVGWDGDPLHPLQTAKDVAAAAGADLIQDDLLPVSSDRSVLGKLLIEALPPAPSVRTEPSDQA